LAFFSFFGQAPRVALCNSCVIAGRFRWR
jgi:hypothetical protein